MALLLLYTAYQGPLDQQDDPGNPGVYTALYLRTEYRWDTDARAVVVSGPYDEPYTGGYSGAQPPPESGGISTTQVVDSYAFEGKTRRVFHDGMGGVTYQDSVPAFLSQATAKAVTAAGRDGQVSVVISGGTPPYAVQLLPYTASPGVTQPGTAGQPVAFGGLLAGPYLVSTTDSGNPQQVSLASTEVPPYVAPKNGCTDPEADNYDPAATADNGSCSYSPRWRSAWRELAVAVAPLAGLVPVPAYLDALLRIGFPAGHPLAAFRPLGAALTVRAVVRPSGEAVFNLGPYLRPALGAPDGSGGYRLDLNTETVDDFFVGYELRRPTGDLLERGYALNSGLPDQRFTTGKFLTGFARVPQWPGFAWKRAVLSSQSAGRYGTMAEAYPPAVNLPCPPNPVPVAWLNPQGGWDFWLFQGRPQLGDDVGDSQAYVEAGTGERRYSQRGEQRRTVQATSGPFRGEDLATGLRTLWGSPQVWYQPVVGGDWVPVTLEGGSFPLRRLGVGRIEVPISFTEAAAQAVQGQ
ncbi:MAG: hypothetical protein ACRYFR_04865 [Janthinobacterium lividum]